MPLSINVGLSRKASKDYQSTGVSINVTAELDQSLLAKPDELQKQIDELYRQADQAIARQVQAHSSTQPTQSRQPQRRDNNGDSHRSNSGSGRWRQDRGHDGEQAGGGMTASQRRAIEAIANRLDIDPAAEGAEQLLLYGRMVRGMAKGVGLPVELHFAVLTKAKKPAIQILDVPSDESALTTVRDNVAQVWQAVKSSNSGGYFANPSPINCVNCPFRSRCPAQGRRTP